MKTQSAGFCQSLLGQRQLNFIHKHETESMLTSAAPSAWRRGIGCRREDRRRYCVKEIASSDDRRAAQPHHAYNYCRINELRVSRQELASPVSASAVSNEGSRLTRFRAPRCVPNHAGKRLVPPRLLPLTAPVLLEHAPNHQVNPVIVHPLCAPRNAFPRKAETPWDRATAQVSRATADFDAV